MNTCPRRPPTAVGLRCSLGPPWLINTFHGRASWTLKWGPGGNPLWLLREISKDSEVGRSRLILSKRQLYPVFRLFLVTEEAGLVRVTRLRWTSLSSEILGLWEITWSDQHPSLRPWQPVPTDAGPSHKEAIGVSKGKICPRPLTPPRLAMHTCRRDLMVVFKLALLLWRTAPLPLFGKRPRLASGDPSISQSARELLSEPPARSSDRSAGPRRSGSST